MADCWVSPGKCEDGFARGSGGELEAWRGGAEDEAGTHRAGFLSTAGLWL